MTLRSRSQTKKFCILTSSFLPASLQRKQVIVSGPLSLSVHLSVQNTFGVPSLWNLLLLIPEVSIPFYSNIVHLLFCAYFINIFSIFRGVELRHFFVQKCLDGVWFVCVICNSNSFHFFIFKLYIMIVPTLKMCTCLFYAYLIIIFSFLVGVELRHFFPSKVVWFV